MQYEARLDEVLQEIVARWDIPGLGVGIVEGDQIVYAKGFGVQSLDTGAPVTPDSTFCVASIAKCFVATAVVQLAERGLIRLDAPLVRYLPYFGLADERSSQITVRQILSHTSGMPDLEDVEYDELLAHPETDDGAAERYVRGLSSRKLAAAPGERFLYSNIAYNVLGDMIARVTGLSFEAYMKAQVLLPAGMPHSTFLLAEVARESLAVPHLRSPQMRVNPVYPYHRADAPASFLHSTVIDMCRWCIACLAGAGGRGQPILSPASYEMMWTPAARWGYPPFYEDMGLGWTLGHFEGFKTVSHGGMGFGWTDFLTLLPQKGRGAIILCNEESSARDRTVDAVVRAMLDREPQVGTVSWMVPLSRALQKGGAEAAGACYAALTEGRLPGYDLDPDDLANLALQLLSVRQLDPASDVLRLNLRAFPAHVDSYLYLAQIDLRQGRPAQAEECLRRVLALEPGHAAAAELLERLR